MFLIFLYFPYFNPREREREREMMTFLMTFMMTFIKDKNINSMFRNYILVGKKFKINA